MAQTYYPYQTGIYGEQQIPQQHFQTESAPLVQQQQPYAIYPSVPQIPQVQSAPQVQVQQQQTQVPQVQSAPQPQPLQRPCCQRFKRICEKLRNLNKKKLITIFLILSIIIYAIGTIKNVFSHYYYKPNHASFTSTALLIALSVVGIVGLKKNNITLMGVFIGMAIFFGVSFIGHSVTTLFTYAYTLRDGANFIQGFFEIVSFAFLISSIVLTFKEIKRIRNETELPLVQQQPQQQEAPVVEAEVAPQVQAPAPVAPAVAVPFVQNNTVPEAPIAGLSDKYKAELVLLREMGFNNQSLNIILLQKHNGHLQSVVQEYIQSH